MSRASLRRRNFPGDRHRRTRPARRGRRHHDAARPGRARARPQRRASIVLVSKPPAPEVAARVLAAARRVRKPVVVNFVGADRDGASEEPALCRARSTMRRARQWRSPRAARPRAGPRRVSRPVCLPRCHALRASSATCAASTAAERSAMKRRALLGELIGPCARTRRSIRELHLADVWQSVEHTVVDLGDDEFTRGRPHPMIDQTLRNERLLKEAADPSVAVILLDVVLGYGAHPDPAASIAAAIETARKRAARARRRIAFVGFICGTDGDPQDYARQEATLRAAGVVLADSNAQAVRIAAAIARRAPAMMRKMTNKPLLGSKLSVLNVGLASFAEAIAAARAAMRRRSIGSRRPTATHGHGRRWRGSSTRPRSRRPTRRHAKPISPRSPCWRASAWPAKCFHGMSGRTILHSGPPIAWSRMCGPDARRHRRRDPLRRLGGRRRSRERHGRQRRHRLRALPSLTRRSGRWPGIISPSMPVWIVAQRRSRATSRSPTSTRGWARCCASARTARRSSRASSGWKPCSPRPCAARWRSMARCRLKPLMAQALHMGDEVHNRNVAASSLLVKRLASALLKTRTAPADIAAMIDFIAGNDHFFLNISMASCKAMLDAAHGVAELEHGHRDGAQRRRVRHSRERARRPLVRHAGAGGQRPLLPELHHRGCSARPGRQRDHGDGGRRRLRDGGGAGDRQVRGRHAAGRRGPYAGDGPHHAVPERRVHAADARLRRDARRASTSGASSTRASCPSSTPASRTASPASGRSAPASRTRRLRASRRPPWRSRQPFPLDRRRCQ